MNRRSTYVATKDSIVLHLCFFVHDIVHYTPAERGGETVDNTVTFCCRTFQKVLQSL